MRTLVRWGLALVAILAGAIGGYRIGAGQWPTWHALMALGTAPAEHAVTGPQPAARERSVLYWKHPDGEPDFSPTPKKTADGRDYRIGDLSAELNRQRDHRRRAEINPCL